ncbi:hypothetical protein BD770DRAFT_432470 [Pilaira anomala]|nr:hypothetical protein BD770DRAFT_432470 [Pilaira anomala]
MMDYTRELRKNEILKAHILLTHSNFGYHFNVASTEQERVSNFYLFTVLVNKLLNKFYYLFRHFCDSWFCHFSETHFPFWLVVFGCGLLITSSWSRLGNHYFYKYGQNISSLICLVVLSMYFILFPKYVRHLSFKLVTSPNHFNVIMIVALM